MSDDKQANDILHELRSAHEELRLTKNSTTLFLKAANEIEGLRREVAGLKEQLDTAINDIACYEAMRDGFTQRATDMEARIVELEGALSQAEFYRDAAHAEHKQTREALDAAYSVHQCRMESCGRDVERLEMRVAELEAALAPFAEQDGLLSRQRYFTSRMFRDAAKAMEGRDE